MSDFRCPHCDSDLKVIPQRSRSSSMMFESVAKRIPVAIGDVPRGWLSSLLWFWRGGAVDYSNPTRTGTITVKVESWDYAQNKVELHDFDYRVDFNIVVEIAQMVNLGHDWTRDNLVKYTSLSENKTRIYVRDFKRLGYIEVSRNNRTEVTSAGRRFFRGVLSVDKRRTLSPT